MQLLWGVLVALAIVFELAALVCHLCVRGLESRKTALNMNLVNTAKLLAAAQESKLIDDQAAEDLLAKASPDYSTLDAQVAVLKWIRTLASTLGAICLAAWAIHGLIAAL